MALSILSDGEISVKCLGFELNLDATGSSNTWCNDLNATVQMHPLQLRRVSAGMMLSFNHIQKVRRPGLCVHARHVPT
jgi:hypothetical protein